MAEDPGYQAIVEKVVAAGRHGPYAVASSDRLGSVTFSLNLGVWQEKDWPEPGNYVILSEIRKKRAGWRAHCGRFVTPSDEEKLYSKEH